MEWQPTPVFLPENLHGQRSLLACSPWGRKDLDMTEHTHTHTHTVVWTKLNDSPLHTGEPFPAPQIGGQASCKLYFKGRCSHEGAPRAAGLTRLCPRGRQMPTLQGSTAPNQDQGQLTHSLLCTLGNELCEPKGPGPSPRRKHHPPPERWGQDALRR